MNRESRIKSSKCAVTRETLGCTFWGRAELGYHCKLLDEEWRGILNLEYENGHKLKP